MTATTSPFDNPSFANPWSLRVFGVTLAAAEAGVFTLQEFQQALIAQIQAFEQAGHCIDSDETYYTRWTEALTALLTLKGVVPAERIPVAEQAVRDALIALRHTHAHHHHDHDHHHRLHPAPVHVERPHES